MDAYFSHPHEAGRTCGNTETPCSVELFLNTSSTGYDALCGFPPTIWQTPS
jgi:hypothetical protein